MQNKPRVGLILLRAAWTSREKTGEVMAIVEQDVQNIIARLSPRFSISGPWVVADPLTLHDCREALVEAELDLVLVAFQTRADDRLLVALLDAIGDRPLVLWSYLPWRRMPHPASFREVHRGSGPVGSITALGTLRNLNVPFLFTWGAPDDPRLLNELDIAARAGQVRQALHEARFGVLPSYQAETQSILVDEQRLHDELGPQVVTINAEEFRRAETAVLPESIAAYLEVARALIDMRGLANDVQERSARTALALAHLAEEHKLDLLAVNTTARRGAFQPLHLPNERPTPEVDCNLGPRPGLYPDLTELEARGPEPVLYLPEGDLGAAAAGYILNRLTGSPLFFFEFYYWDEIMNQMVGGHAGMQDPALAVPGQLWAGPGFDFIFEEDSQGAQLQMIARPGRVTIFQLRGTPTGWQAVAASGVALETRPLIEGYPHVVLRLDTPIEHFLNHLATVGASRHWLMAYGSVLHEIEAFCQIEGIPIEVLR